jgi:hypothetical protein
MVTTENQKPKDVTGSKSDHLTLDAAERGHRMLRFVQCYRSRPLISDVRLLIAEGIESCVCYRVGLVG